MKRNTSLDALRALACLFVIIIHVSADFVVDFMNDNSNFQFTAGNFFDSLARTSVPLFIMLSGAFLLSNKRNLDYIPFYKKTFLKIGIPTLIWSSFYIVFGIIYGPKLAQIKGREFSILSLFQNWFYGVPYYHLWYLYSISGLYVVTPILIKLISKINPLRFFILSLLILILDIIIAYNHSFFWTFDFILYLGYFMLGFSLKRYFDQNKISIKLPLFFSILSFGLIFGLSEYFVRYNLYNKSLYFYKFLSPFVATGAASIFILFINLKFEKEYFQYLSQHSFNIYLIHPFVLAFFQHFYEVARWKDFNAFIYIPLVSLLVFYISLIISRLIFKSCEKIKFL